MLLRAATARRPDVACSFTLGRALVPLGGVLASSVDPPPACADPPSACVAATDDPRERRDDVGAGAGDAALADAVSVLRLRVAAAGDGAGTGGSVGEPCFTFRLPPAGFAPCPDDLAGLAVAGGSAGLAVADEIGNGTAVAAG